MESGDNMDQGHNPSEGSPNKRPKMNTNLTPLEIQAVTAELELLKPILKSSIKEENPGITEQLLDHLLKLKLSDAKEKIPQRWIQEPKFQAEKELCTHLLTSLNKVLNNLQAKDKCDQSAEIEIFQAKSALVKWDTHHGPSLKASFDMVKSFWFKPSEDPLTKVYLEITETVDNLKALLKHELSVRNKRPRAADDKQEYPAKIQKCIGDSIEQRSKVSNKDPKDVQSQADVHIDSCSLTCDTLMSPECTNDINKNVDAAVNKDQSQSLAINSSSCTLKYKGIQGTANCYLLNPSSMTMVKVHVLLDSGSNVSLVGKDSAKKAGLKGTPHQLHMNVAGNQTVVSEQQEIVFQLVSLDKLYVSPQLVGITIDKIGNDFKPINIDPKRFSHLKNLKFTEHYPSKGYRPIEVLISEPYYSQLMLPDQRVSIDPAIPSAKLTRLGWILRGAAGVEQELSQNYHFSEADHINFDLAMIYKDQMENFDFGKFWSGENVGIRSDEPDIKSETALEIQADLHQQNTAQYNESEKCWYVELPWIDPSPEGRSLTDNTNRAHAMWRKVLTTVKPEHMDLVNDAYNEIFENGYSEIVPEDQINRNDHPTYVMTSRPVIKPDRATTKCRIVVNASLPDQKNKKRTLNSLLMPGKNLLPQIMVLILQSKLKRYIASIDIKKMFLSVKLKKESDKDMLRYLWAPPGADEPVLYRYTRLVFGGVCSPYLAIWCLKETAKKWQKIYPKAVEIILNLTYMDDIVVTADTIQEIIALIKQILIILESGGLYGHKITANDPKVLQSVDPSRIDKSPEISLLGLLLNHTTNEFKFDLDNKFQQFSPLASKITRRDIVSLASQVFDTQGYVAPFVMQYKKLLPMLWHNKTAWDENLLTKTITDENGTEKPDPIAREAVKLFKEWIEQIPLLKELHFPRWMGGPIQFIAIFGDASKMGMGVAAYAVCKQSDSKLTSQLIFSKSSLMPKNLRKGAEAEDALTIARAELIALLMATKLGQYLHKAYKDLAMPTNTVYFTDSLLNLQRVQRGLGFCNVWEERRIKQILENSKESSIRFCPGVLNPADLPSRGCSLKELIAQFQFWTNGPEFLLKPKQQWPVQPVPSSQTTDPANKVRDKNIDSDLQIYFSQVLAINSQEAEILKAKTVEATKKDNEKAKDDKVFLDKLLENSSTWYKAVKVLVRIKRLANKIREKSWQRSKNSKNPNNSCWMTQSEVNWAELQLFKRVQEVTFNKEIEILKKGPLDHNNKLPKKSLLKNLPIYWDEVNGIIRLKSRLHLASSLPFSETNPIIIPKGRAAELKILHIHQTRIHISQKQTFHLLREKYWVIGNLDYVKAIVRKCPTPRCRYVKFCSPKMSPLPAARIDRAEAWAHVGVDYMGPITVNHDCLRDMMLTITTNPKYNDLTTAKKKEKAKELAAKCIHPKTHKVWLAMFTCFHTRAIHVELIHSCTTRDFLFALRKFIGHCGRPYMFYSDNAKYFGAADKHIQQLLKHLDFHEIQQEMFNGDAAIQWKFSTPEAPWTNGVTERMVGIFKKQFRIAVQKESLSALEIETLLVELKSIINDRPLGVSSQDPADWSNITPNLLIFGKPMRSISTAESATFKNLDYAEMWLARKRVLNAFLSKWRKEYLNDLTLPKKWLTNENVNLSPGDVVLVKPDTLVKNTWKLGRIESVEKDKANVVKSVIVRMPYGHSLQRSARNVALLEPDFATREMKLLNLLSESGRPGRGGQTLTGPAWEGPPELESVSPDQYGRYHSKVTEKDDGIPEPSVTVTADSVSQSKTSGNNCPDATDSIGQRLRKRGRRSKNKGQKA